MLNFYKLSQLTMSLYIRDRSSSLKIADRNAEGILWIKSKMNLFMIHWLQLN